MSIWVEVRCDLRRDDQCFSQTAGSAPGQLAYPTTHAAVDKAMSMLMVAAVKEGWLLESSRMICPACARTRRQAKEA